VQKESGYVWHQMSEYRWLCVAEDETATIVGGIVKEGFRRYRIQLPGREGTLCSGPVVFERFKTAELSLKAKLGIYTIQREIFRSGCLCKVGSRCCGYRSGNFHGARSRSHALNPSNASSLLK
jgi:hypothetical protein